MGRKILYRKVFMVIQEIALKNLSANEFSIIPAKKSSDTGELLVFTQKEENKISPQQLAEAEQRKSELHAKNDEILKGEINKIVQELSNNAHKQMQTILGELNRAAQKPDMQLSLGVSIKGVNGGASGIYINVQGNTLIIEAHLFDCIENCPKGVNGLVESNTSESITIDNSTLQEVAKSYLGTKIDQAFKLPSDGIAVLEYAPDGFTPVVTANKDKQGILTIQIDKHGIKTTITFPTNEGVNSEGKENSKSTPEKIESPTPGLRQGLFHTP